MIVNPERLADGYELDAKVNTDIGMEQDSVPVVAMRLWLRAAHAVVELTGPADSNGKTFGSDGNVLLWLHESDLALGNILLNRISSENDKLREFAADACTVLRNHYDKDWFDGTIFAERMRELGIEASHDD